MTRDSKHFLELPPRHCCPVATMFSRGRIETYLNLLRVAERLISKQVEEMLWKSSLSDCVKPLSVDMLGRVFRLELAPNDVT